MVDAHSNKGDIHTHISFLARNAIYTNEKPYITTFPVGNIPGAKATNHTIETKPITVHDLRHSDVNLDLDTNGACLLKATTSLQQQDASDAHTPSMETFINEILVILQGNFPEYSDIRPMDFQLRKRDPGFPHDTDKGSEFAQPATLPHTDFSVHGAYMRLEDVFPGERETYPARSFDLINVWKVLSGPNDDWPLALCDFESVDWEEDTTANDAIHPQRLGENWLLHHSEKHLWYYLSAMEEDDLIVLRNADSEGKRCFHVAFYNPDASSPPRQSVELRFVAFRT